MWYIASMASAALEGGLAVLYCPTLGWLGGGGGEGIHLVPPASDT